MTSFLGDHKVNTCKQIISQLTGEKFQKFFDSVISGKSVSGIFERVRGVDLDPLDHEADVVGDAIAVEIWKIKKKLQVRLQERIKIHLNSVITNVTNKILSPK